jgi:cold shock CspA family protein
MISGTVASFDERRGDGEFTADDGEHFYFHCVSIADGSRSIGVGVRARAERAVGHRGYDEVVDLAEEAG